MSTNNIKRWQDRTTTATGGWRSDREMEEAKQAEIADLRASLSSTPSNLTEGEISLPTGLCRDDTKHDVEYFTADMVREAVLKARQYQRAVDEKIIARQDAELCRLRAATKAPAPADAPTTAKNAAVRFDDADNLSVMLWLLRRLPRAYGNPPNVIGPIQRLAKRTGTDIADCLAERAGSEKAQAGEDA